MIRTQNYKRIPGFENRRRVALLTRFRGLLVKYDSQVRAAGYGPLEELQDDESKATRTEINVAMDEADAVVEQAGIPTFLKWTPPAAVGGFIQDVPLLTNYFNLYQYQIPDQVVLDCIDRAVGRYQGDERNADRRTWNPFYWVGLVVDAVASAPFAFIRRAGIETAKLEHSPLGRWLKFVLWLATAIVPLLTLLDLLDLRESFLEYIGFEAPSPNPEPPQSPR